MVMFFRSSFFKIAVALVLVAALIFLINFFGAGATSFVRGSILTVARPLFSLSSIMSHFFLARSGGFSEEETALLIKENQRLKAALFGEEVLRDEVSRLRHVLSFSEEKKETLLGARVILFGQDVGKEFFLVDQGKKAGVKEGNFAVDEEGMLLGAVVETGERFSKIEIASNSGRTFEVEIWPLRARALARGIGGRTFSLELIPSDAPIAVGDFVKTVSAGGAPLSFLFAAVAEISSSGSAPFQGARAVLLAWPEKLSEVFIVKR